MPNSFAYIALLAWPIFSFFLYFRLSALNATFWTLVGGYLFLPVNVEFDFPLIPSLNKESIPALTAVFGCLFIKKVDVQFIPRAGIERVIVLTLLVLPLFTVLTNSEPAFNGSIFNRGLKLYDAVSIVSGMFLTLIPYMLGRSLIRSQNDILVLLELIVVAGLIYSPFLLFEARMSPQLHSYVYGFFPHSFIQQVRFDGFRPVVFLGHGLLVAIFYTVVLLASVILHRTRKSIFGFPLFLVIGYIAFLLLLSKSVGPLLLGVFGLLVIGLFSASQIRFLALTICSVVLTYPLLSLLQIFPHGFFVDIAAYFDVDRAGSLAFRFYHEGLLLEHATQKLFFGWGDEGRNRLYGSITDGFWIILLGKYGIVGFLSIFSLLIAPIFVLSSRARNLSSTGWDKVNSSFSLLISLALLDQIPNMSLYSWLWFIGGASAGLANLQREKLLLILGRDGKYELSSKTASDL